MTYPIIILLVVLAVLALSLLLYLAGFRPKKLKIKWGFGEAELEREPPGDAQAPPAAPSPATTVDQQAAEGGVIRGSPVKAPADSGAQLTQKATGDKSRIDDSGITLE